MMPRLDGVRMLERVRRERPPGLEHIVVVTGDRTAPDGAELARLGARAVVSKPVEPEHIVGLLRTLAPGRAGHG
jgi:DNA-binding NarL/FixJ family response regulator